MRGLFHMRQNQGISRRPQLSHSTISPLADVTRLSTADGSDTAQWEVQVAITEDGYELLSW